MSPGPGRPNLVGTEHAATLVVTLVRATLRGDTRGMQGSAIEQAAAARRRGELAEATEAAEAAVAAAPADPRAWVLLGSIDHLRGNLERAASRYRRALALAPRDAAAHAALAVNLVQRGQPAAARAHFAAATAADASPPLDDLQWLQAFQQARELDDAGAALSWSRCATPLPSPREPVEPPMGPPAARGRVTWSIAELTAALRTSTRIVALTGAGMSAASGLQTRKQLWQQFPRDDAVSIARFREDPSTLWSVIRAFWGDVPHLANAGHHALARLPGLAAIVTQNVDELHQAAAAAAGRATPVIELHGSLSQTRCLGCGRPGEATAQALAAADRPLPPRCDCGGVLRPDVVLFGEQVPAAMMAAARAQVTAADLLLVIGCAMDVSPARELPLIAARAGARIVELKRRPSRLAAAVRVHHLPGAAEDILPEVARALEPAEQRHDAGP
ncbi:SIR2 family NAD-dependent protein deacylase [Nannocystis pusilla]|uniref:protein acetyllysine N-acetyltransferase n=1 Tax=Nannocystis pusilla TaxID=889268 RepID=A0ABS7U086_9BACT|nr:Sir2 family NAD-dependent protein deacetylase [Nannocystis pusilla]MBZ5713870.1 tetratricopeptide repeat protein [Nannocystis pusilla]